MFFLQYATRKIHLKFIKTQEKAFLKKLCILSRDIYNQALINIEEHLKEKNQLLFWQHNVKLIKSIEQYKQIGTCYNAVIEEAHANYRKYLSTQNNTTYYPSYFGFKDYWKKAAPPTKKEDFFPIMCDNFSISNGRIKLPISNYFKDTFPPIYFNIPEDLKDKKIQRFIIRPSFDFSEYELLLIFEDKKIKAPLDYRRALAIDLGVENFASAADSEGQSFIIDGRYLKALIQGFAKYSSKITKTKYKQGIKGYTKKQKTLIMKTHNRIEDYLNKSVRYIIDYCINNKIGNLIIGVGVNFKQPANLGHVNNLIFESMPYSRFWDKLQYQCQKYGIVYSRQNECYTSKASFLDNDPLPLYVSKKKYTFSGKRKYRGLYVAADGRLINADTNGALNTMKAWFLKSNLISQEKISALQARRSIASPLRIRVF